MVAGTIQLGRRNFVILPQNEYEELRRRASVDPDIEAPRLPPRLPSGNYPAVDALRVGLARKLIGRRQKSGLTQAELARRAGIRVETLNRIEKAKVTADTATISKIARVLDKAERDAR